MNLITGGRQSGKTHQLIEWVKAGSDRVIVTHSQAEADRLVREYKLKSDQVMAFTFPTRRLLQQRPNVSIAIDNLDMALFSIFGTVPETVTWTGPNPCE